VSRSVTVAEGGRLDRATGIIALGLSGIAAYAYLAVAARALGAAGFAPLGAAWAVVFLASSAFATPLEVGMARAVGAARGRGETVRPWLRAGFVLAGTAAIVALGAALVGGRWSDEAVFGGQDGIALACGVAFAGLTVGAVAKGACAGAGRLAGWGGYLLVDGGTRLALSVLAAALAPSPQAFALALALGPWVALAAPAVPVRRLVGSPGRKGSDDGVVGLARSIAPLVVAAAASAALMYLGAVLLPLLVRGPDAQVGAYIAALALARLPLFVFSPLVAIAVPRIAFALAQGHDPDARRTAAALVGIAAAGGLAAISVALITGGGSLAAVFGAGFSLPERSLWAVAIAAACWLLATAATSVAIAAGRGRLAAWAWCAGLAVAGVAAVVAGPDAFARTDGAVLSGAVAASLAAGVAAVAALRGVQRAGDRAAPADGLKSRS
jgi:O-antigen/teichoic acid export membrane protein